MVSVRIHIRPKHRAAAILAGLFLFAVNAAVYATWPRLVARFRRQVGRFPNIAEPKTFNDKITWRKVFDRNPLFPVLQDKLAARDYVAVHCPEMALPEILWRGHDPFAIPFDHIHEPVVIKTNHGCGYNYFMHDPQSVDRLAVSVFFAKALGERWGADAWEWAYGAINPTLYVEKLLLGSDGAVEDDCKIDVYAGQALVYYLSQVRSGRRSAAFYDRHNRPIEASIGHYETCAGHPPGPLHDRAKALAESLCPGLDAVRVDCYIHDGRVWFGEFTMYPGSGFGALEPASFAVDRCRAWNILNSHYFTIPGVFRNLYRLSLEARVRWRETMIGTPEANPRRSETA